MKKYLGLLCLLSVLLTMMPVTTQAGPVAELKVKRAAAKFPCSLILGANNNLPVNAKGVALVYPVKTVGVEKISLSIHAQYLPEPSAGGNYDRYEGFAQVPGVISWRFILYPTPAPEVPTWAGRFDDISASLDNATVQVRFSHSKTGALGPAVLEGSMNACK